MVKNFEVKEVLFTLEDGQPIKVFNPQNVEFDFKEGGGGVESISIKLTALPNNDGSVMSMGENPIVDTIPSNG